MSNKSQIEKESLTEMRKDSMTEKYRCQNIMRQTMNVKRSVSERLFLFCRDVCGYHTRFLSSFSAEIFVCFARCTFFFAHGGMIYCLIAFHVCSCNVFADKSEFSIKIFALVFSVFLRDAKSVHQQIFKHAIQFFTFENCTKFFFKNIKCS